eukprot:360758-Chlamydomonas_euryale.AAC.2
MPSVGSYTARGRHRHNVRDGRVHAAPCQGLRRPQRPLAWPNRQAPSPARMCMQAVIGTMGEMDAYMLPDAKGYAALNRYLLGLTDDERQRRRDEILATSPSDFRAFADAVAAASGDVGGRVVAVTSAEKARAVLERSPGYWDVHKVL